VTSVLHPFRSKITPFLLRV